MLSSSIITGLFALLFLYSPSPTSASPLSADFPEVSRSGSRRELGVTADACLQDSDCKGDRHCIEKNSPLLEVPCTEGLSCRCFPHPWLQCAQSTDCETREVCTKLPESAGLPRDVPNPFCLSAVISGHTPEMTEVAGASKRHNKSPSHGLTLFPCKQDKDCYGDRGCMSHSSADEDMMPCAPEEGCFCFPNDINLCTEETICEDGELCAQVPGEVQICVAADAEAALTEVTAVDETIGGAERRTAGGVTGDACKVSLDCLRGRICVLSSAPLDLIPCDRDHDCLCAPPSGPNYCDTDEDCVVRETCTKMPDSADPFCVSTVLVGYSEDLKAVSDDSKSEKSHAAGFTLYPCKNDEHCEGDRSCVFDGGDVPTSCEKEKGCFCYPKVPKLCSGSQDCESREVCARMPHVQMCVSEDAEATFSEIIGVGSDVKNPSDPDVSHSPDSEVHEPEESAESEGAEASPESTFGTSTSSPSVTPSPSPSPIPIPIPSPSNSNSNSNSNSDSCIDAEALTHMLPEDLVFEKHEWSRVLCDQNNSCATKGHMVTFRGKAMKMDSYCSLVTCSEKVKLVNSPKYRRGLRVESNTEGLRYTAFAARYETSAEEAVMAAAVRVGL